MAMTSETRRQSKKMIMSVFIVVIMGWFTLLGWAMSLWALSSFDSAWQRVYRLSNQQLTTITAFNDTSVAEYLKSTLNHVPSVQLPNDIMSMTGAVREELHSRLPNTPLINSQVAADTIQMGKQVWWLVVITGHVMLIKLTILIAALPLFALTMTAGLVDGLNQRFIRTASLGRESSYVFHRLNHFFKRGLIILLALWLAIPVSITPAMMFVPVSILLSLMVSITASRFKKYL